MAVTTAPETAGNADLPPEGVGAPGRAQIPFRTLRTDRWWLAPVLTVAGISAFIVYATVRVMMQKNFWVDPYHYLTPFYSPCLSQQCPPDSALLGRLPFNFPPLVPFAIATLPFLLLFRFTCYYYRKAYYRSFWFSPPACAVPEPHAKYTGETKFPLVLQNLHRYFFFAAVIISIINTVDGFEAFHSPSGFGIGLGTIIIWVNVIFLWAYTLSCHSCRHITLGRINNFSAHPVRYKFWQFVSKLNAKHMNLAWTTLGTLVLTDAYIALVASGTISDLRLIG